MPGKGRRVASRQSQLGQRRRRNSKNAQSTTNAVMSSSTDASNAAPDGVTAVTAVTASSIVADVNSSVAESRSRNNLADRSPYDTHVKSEITRIVILGSILAIALVGLSLLI